jgi:protein N-terminal amidase
MTSPTGEMAAHYRKTFLYEADEKWGCSEGPKGFASHGPIEGLGGLKVQFGICMDLNPFKFEAPFEAYEFATAARSNGVSLVICPMAWLNSQSPSLQPTPDKVANKRLELEQALKDSDVDLSTVNYWLLRMTPVFRTAKPLKRVGFLCCNRSGWEDDVLYAGSSSIFTFDPSAGSENSYVRYHGSLGQNEEGLLTATLNLD